MKVLNENCLFRYCGPIWVKKCQKWLLPRFLLSSFDLKSHGLYVIKVSIKCIANRVSVFVFHAKLNPCVLEIAIHFL